MSKWLHFHKKLKHSIKNFFSAEGEVRKPLFAVVNDKKKKDLFHKNQESKRMNLSSINEEFCSPTHNAYLSNQSPNQSIIISSSRMNDPPDALYRNAEMQGNFLENCHESFALRPIVIPDFFYQYAIAIGITLEDKRRNLKYLIDQFKLFRESMEKKKEELDQLYLAMGKKSLNMEKIMNSFNASYICLGRGLTLYMIFRVGLSTTETGITKQIWNDLVPLISESLPPNKLTPFHKVLSSNHSAFTGGIPLIQLMKSHNFLQKEPEDTVIFLAIAFELQDMDVLQFFKKMFFEKYFQDLHKQKRERTSSNLAHDEINSSSISSQEKMKDLEIYMYILGQVTMLSTRHSLLEAIELWEYIKYDKIKISDSRILCDICTILCDAIHHVRLDPEITRDFLISILNELHERGITPTAELLNKLMKYNTESSINLWASQYVRDLYSALTKIDSGSVTNKVQLSEYRDVLEYHILQRVYNKFPKAGIRYMSQSALESWIINQIRTEESSQLPALLELHRWLQLIYSQESTENIVNTFIDQIGRIPTNHEKLAYVFQLKTTFPDTNVSKICIFNVLKDYISFYTEVNPKVEFI